MAVDEASHLVVLADGMGGYNAGEVASGMATIHPTSLGAGCTEASDNASDTESAPRDGHLCRQRQPRDLQRRQPIRSTPAWAPRWWWACSAMAAR